MLEEKNEYQEDEENESDEHEVAELLKKFNMAKIERKPFEGGWDKWSHAYERAIYRYAEVRSERPNESAYTVAIETSNSDYSFNLPVEFSIIIRKAAAIMKALPKPSWVTLNRKAIKSADVKAELFGSVFDWVLYMADADVEIFKLVLGSLVFGDAFAWVYHEYREVACKVPELSSTGELGYKDKKSVISQTRFTCLDIRNFWYSPGAKSISDADYAFITEYYTLEKAKSLFPEVSDWDAVPKVSRNGSSSVFRNPQEELQGDGKAVFVEVINYYNQVCDEYKVVIGKELVKSTPIPSLPVMGMKQIPVAVIQNHLILNSPYALSECALVEDRRKIKNDTFSLAFKTGKQNAYGTLVVDPYADFDESTFSWGQDVVRAERGMIDVFRANADMSWLQNFMNQNEDGITVDTGIDHRNVVAVQNETATQTLERKESSLAIVELVLTWNISNGFKRLFLLLKDLIRLHYKSYPVVKPDGGYEAGSRSIRVEGKKFGRAIDGGLDVEESPGYSYFELLPDDLKDDFDLILNTGNIALTTALKKQLQQAAIQSITQIAVPEGQQPGYSYAGLVKFLAKDADLPEYVLNQEAVSLGKGNLDQEAKKDLIKINPKKDASMVAEEVFGGNEKLAEQAAIPAIAGKPNPRPESLGPMESRI